MPGADAARQRMLKVILPQAVRIATPPTVGFMVQIIKNTSLASVVGFVELARSGQIINNSMFEPFLVYMMIAVIYFAAVLSALVLEPRKLERPPAAWCARACRDTQTGTAMTSHRAS